LLGRPSSPFPPKATSSICFPYNTDANLTSFLFHKPEVAPPTAETFIESLGNSLYCMNFKRSLEMLPKFAKTEAIS